MKKRTFLMLSASMLMAAGLSSCEKDRAGKQAEEAGEATTALLSLTFRQSEASRATTDTNATDDEAAIKSVDVFIYTEGGAYLSRKTLTPADFTTGGAVTGADAYTSTVPIPTTTGYKNILVGVNLPSAAATSLENKQMSTARTLTQTIARSAINTTVGLPMFSTEAKRYQMVDDPTANKVIVTVQRLVAKVTVEKDAAMTQDGSAGTLGQLEWAIDNQNTKYYLLQGAPAAYPDPNWTETSYAATDFEAATVADYKAVNDANPTPISAYRPQYALENTSSAKLQKELTRVTVRATFIPAQWATSYTPGSNVVNPVANNSASPVTFYGVTPGVGQSTVYFQNKADADNYASDQKVTAVTYTDGYCYWNIFLNKAHTGDVYRNDFYKCKILRVVAPGQNSPELTAPNAQPETSTTMTVDVDILHWNTPVMDDYDLIP